MTADERAALEAPTAAAKKEAVAAARVAAAEAAKAAAEEAARRICGHTGVQLHTSRTRGVGMIVKGTCFEGLLVTITASGFWWMFRPVLQGSCE